MICGNAEAALLQTVPPSSVRRTPIVHDLKPGYIPPMNRQWRRCALVVLGFLVGGGRTARADSDAVLSSQLTECIEAAAGVRGVDPEMATKLFARTCSAACPGLPAYAATEPGHDWRPLGDQCQLFCSPNARAAFEAAPPARRWAVLADSCGTDYYGLPAGQGALLSDVWFVLQRIGVWLQHAKPAAGPKSRLALADLAKTLPLDRFVLPLPGVLPHRFHLPEATHAFDDIRSRDYLVIGAEQVSFGTRPEAKLTVDGARLDTVFPGDPIALADLPARHVPFRVPAAKIPVGGARGVLSPPPSAADKTLAVVRRNAPLLFADRALPAARVAQVLKTLGPDGGYLGVTDGQGHAGAHTVVHGAAAGDAGADDDPVARWPADSCLSVTSLLAGRVARRAQRDGRRSGRRDERSQRRRRPAHDPV